MHPKFTKNLSALILVLVSGCSSQQVTEPSIPTPPPVAATIAPVEATPEPQKLSIEPQAMAALERMGNYLRTLKSFTVNAQNSIDEKLDSGQKVMIDGETVFTVKRPNRLHISRKVMEDDIDQQFFYDGKTFTLYGNQVKFYASIPAPDTIKELLTTIADKYDIEIPLADLFHWGSDANTSAKAAILAASYVGIATINGVACEHYAFRNADVDWQLWIEKDATPLPRKLVITTTGEEGHPQFSSTMNWNLSPKIKNKQFTFVPPKDAHKIDFVLIEESFGNNK